MTDEQKKNRREVNQAWKEQHTISFGVRLNRKTDADIIAKLEGAPSRQGELKRLVRLGIRSEDNAKKEGEAMKAYYVRTNAYDMVVVDFGEFRRVHVVDDVVEDPHGYLEQIASWPENLSGEDYYDMTSYDLIGEAEIVAEVRHD